MISRLPALLAHWAGALIAAAASLIPLIEWRLSMSTPTPVPAPNPTTWKDALADLKADARHFLVPLVNFEAALATKDTATIIEGAAAVPQQLVAALPSVGADVLQQLLSVVIAKATTALTPAAPPSP